MENRAAELGSRRGSQRGKLLCITVKYWLHMLHMDGQRIVRNLEPYSSAIFCCHWKFFAQRLDHWPSKIRPLHGLETLCNKHTMMEHNIQEEWSSKLHHFASLKTHLVWNCYKWQWTNLHITGIIWWVQHGGTSLNFDSIICVIFKHCHFKHQLHLYCHLIRHYHHDTQYSSCWCCRQCSSQCTDNTQVTQCTSTAQPSSKTLTMQTLCLSP